MKILGFDARDKGDREKQTERQREGERERERWLLMIDTGVQLSRGSV